MIKNNFIIPTDNIIKNARILKQICGTKTKVLVFVYSSKKSKTYYLYNMLKNSEMDAIVLCCENKISEMLRAEKIVRENFSNCEILFIHSCFCNNYNYGNFNINISPLYVINENKLCDIGDINISIFDNKKHNKLRNGYIEKMQTLMILNGAYNMLYNAFC